MEAIRFGTDGWRATLEIFTRPRVRMVGQAIATYLDGTDQSSDTVAVGYDARETSRGFAEELCRVFCANGFDVLLPPRDIPTPVLAYTVASRELAGGVMITASHNPPEYNGVKFIPSDGAPALPTVTDAIEANIAPPTPRSESMWGRVREVGFIEPYFDHICALVSGDLSGLRIAYDAMHGSGRGVTDRVLERAGATVERIRCTQQSDFGGTPPEPNESHLTELVRTVRDGFDLGIANDGDADRIAIVTPDGGYLDENLFFAALYSYLLETKSGPAIRTVSTTFLIDRIASDHGESVIETPVGFKWVAEAMVEHDALIGGEESGGFSIRGHIREKDGVLMALAAAMAATERSLDDRVQSLFDTYGVIHQGKRSVSCPDSEKDRVLTELRDRLPRELVGIAVEQVTTSDGAKLLLTDGSWVLIRPSGTEPKIRVYAEADSESHLDALLTAGEQLVQSYV